MAHVDPAAFLTEDDLRGLSPGVLHPAIADLVRRYLVPATNVLHRPTLDGLENLPRDRPFLLVANHGAGIGASELSCLAARYVEQVGEGQKLAGFAHPIAFRFPGFRTFMRNLGAVPSTYASGRSALAAGVPLLVFPGGDHETLRPFWEHEKVTFGGRRGFLKLAREANVPIVPLGIRGAHLSAPILWRSRRLLPTLLVLPRLFGIKRWGVSALAAGGALFLLTRSFHPALRALAAWAWLGSPLTFLPVVPTTIRMRVGAPIEPGDLFHPGDPDLEAALDRVEGAVQGLVTELGRKGAENSSASRGV